MAKYRLTAEVNTSHLDLDHLIDSEDTEAVQNWLQYDSGDTPVDEALTNIKLERIPD